MSVALICVCNAVLVYFLLAGARSTLFAVNEGLQLPLVWRPVRFSRVVETDLLPRVTLLRLPSLPFLYHRPMAAASGSTFSDDELVFKFML